MGPVWLAFYGRGWVLCVRPVAGQVQSELLTLGATGAGEGDLEDCSDGLRSAFLLWRCGDRALHREEVEDSEVSLSELVDTYSFDLNC